VKCHPRWMAPKDPSQRAMAIGNKRDVAPIF